MLDKTYFCVAALILNGCAVPETKVAEPALPPAQVSVPATTPPGASALELRRAAEEEAKALVAQAETDVQRARARRALWLKAWEDLVAARQAMAASDHAAAGRHARRASELALLGLEQLAYPAVR